MKHAAVRFRPAACVVCAAPARGRMENPHMQDPRLDAVFLAYEKLVAQTDTLFGRVRDQFPAEVGCKAGWQRLLPRHVRPFPARGHVY